MNPVDIIMRKRDGNALTSEEINAFVRGCTDASFADYQLSALLMAICLRGMDARETVDLTLAMARSGAMLDLSGVDGVTVDKHSTGGVGDTTTLVLAPLLACCGAKVAKMSGRGLGHTGGTLDKLEAVPGLSISMEHEAFVRQVNEIGLAVVGQTAELAPADKVLYALRDVTGTVESLPLVVSSILSKKLVSGADAIVLDVKSGSGAIMKTLEKSAELARTMVDIGNRAGKRFSALVTNMDEPLGMYVGNALEVEEAIDVLAGRAEGPLREVSLRLGVQALCSAGLYGAADARAALEQALQSGRGLEKLAQMFEKQGGDARVTEDTRLLPQPVSRETVRAAQSGYVAGMRTVLIGNAARLLGAGRLNKADVIDPSVGIKMKVRVGDYVSAGDALCELALGRHSDAEGAKKLLGEAFAYSPDRPAPKPLVYETIGERA